MSEIGFVTTIQPQESLEEKHKGVSMGDTEVLLRAIEKPDYRSVGQ